MNVPAVLRQLVAEDFLGRRVTGDEVWGVLASKGIRRKRQASATERPPLAVDNSTNVQVTGNQNRVKISRGHAATAIVAIVALVALVAMTRQPSSASDSEQPAPAVAGTSTTAAPSTSSTLDVANSGTKVWAKWKQEDLCALAVSAENSPDVTLGNCGETGPSVWEQRPVDSELLMLVVNGSCLAVGQVEEFQEWSHAPVELETCIDNPSADDPAAKAQLWTVSGEEIRNALGLYLDVDGDGRDGWRGVGSPVQVWDRDDSAAQRWTVESLGA